VLVSHHSRDSPYLPDGSNIDVCRKEMIEDGIEIAAPGTTGAELVDELKPDKSIRLPQKGCFKSEFQLVAGMGDVQAALGCLYQTALESHLHTLRYSSILWLQFSQCPRASIYGAV